MTRKAGLMYLTGAKLVKGTIGCRWRAAIARRHLGVLLVLSPTTIGAGMFLYVWDPLVLYKQAPGGRTVE